MRTRCGTVFGGHLATMVVHGAVFSCLGDNAVNLMYVNDIALSSSSAVHGVPQGSENTRRASDCPPYMQLHIYLSFP
ncbi:hypothetical protein BJ878DRAFT_500248 [Calycina marina]|uniref:Secreted protein n=1 Tax=Calycina marina TaxID=1763456 RepID=A0A9P8CG01_9HELO|nr:hypothetical protein BJ878DRAFT_500248 [Calycina marina]